MLVLFGRLDTLIPIGTNNYWSPQRYNKRIKEYKEELKWLRNIKAHNNNIEIREIIRSVVFSMSIHKLAYKTKRGEVRHYEHETV